MTDVFAGFWPPCWCPSRWAPTWRLHTNLYKFGKNVSPHIFRKKNCCDLNPGESLCISTFFLFPDSRPDRLNGFYFLFWSILNGVTLKTSNCQINRSRSMTYPIKYNFMCLFAYWQWKSADERARISAVIVKIYIASGPSGIDIQSLTVVFSYYCCWDISW